VLTESPGLGTAAGVVIGWLDEHVGEKSIAAIGHRVVHGGPRYSWPQVITGALLAAPRRITPFDPEHLPRRDRGDGAISQAAAGCHAGSVF